MKVPYCSPERCLLSVILMHFDLTITRESIHSGIDRHVNIRQKKFIRSAHFIEVMKDNASMD